MEACNNAIQYAEGAARGLPVLVEVISDSETVELRVQDHTAGFNWPAQATLPGPDQERGRGLYLIQTLMDHASYLRSHGSNCLFMRKERSATSVLPDLPVGRSRISPAHGSQPSNTW